METEDGELSITKTYGSVDFIRDENIGQRRCIAGDIAFLLENAAICEPDDNQLNIPHIAMANSSTSEESESSDTDSSGLEIIEVSKPKIITETICIYSGSEDDDESQSGPNKSLNDSHNRKKKKFNQKKEKKKQKDCKSKEENTENVVSKLLSNLVLKVGKTIRGDDDTSSDDESSDDAIIVSEKLKRIIAHEERVEVFVPKVKNEVLIQELPEEESDIIVLSNEDNLSRIGIVCSVIEKMIVIKADITSPALDADTAFFLHDKTYIGKVFDTFGPVKCPFYSVRVPNTQETYVKNGAIVYFVPYNQDLTKYVFVEKIKKLGKGSDASWMDDCEPPVQHLDYSDDEEERKMRKELKEERRAKNKHGDTLPREASALCDKKQTKFLKRSRDKSTKIVEKNNCKKLSPAQNQHGGSQFKSHVNQTDVPPQSFISQRSVASNVINSKVLPSPNSSQSSGANHFNHATVNGLSAAPINTMNPSKILNKLPLSHSKNNFDEKSDTFNGPRPGNNFNRPLPANNYNGHPQGNDLNMPPQGNDFNHLPQGNNFNTPLEKHFNGSLQGSNFSRPPLGNNFSGPQQGNNSNEPPPENNYNPLPQGNNFSGPPQGKFFNGPPQGNNYNQPPQGNNFSGPQQGNNSNGPPPENNYNPLPQGNNFSGPPQGKIFNGPPQGNNYNQPPPGNNFSGPQPGNNYNQPPPGNNFSGPQPGNNYNQRPKGNNFNNPPPGTNFNGTPPSNGFNGPLRGNGFNGPPPRNNLIGQPSRHSFNGSLPENHFNRENDLNRSSERNHFNVNNVNNQSLGNNLNRNQPINNFNGGPPRIRFPPPYLNNYELSHEEHNSNFNVNNNVQNQNTWSNTSIRNSRPAPPSQNCVPHQGQRTHTHFH